MTQNPRARSGLSRGLWVVILLASGLVVAGTAAVIHRSQAGSHGSPHGPAAPATSSKLGPAPAMTLIGGNTMGGTWSIKLPVLPAGATAREIEHQVTLRLDLLESQLSNWREDSAVSQFNRSRSVEWFAVPGDLAAVVTEARHVSELTGGAFDITVAPLVELWGFGPTRAKRGPRQQFPSNTEITAARRHVGYRLLEVRNDRPALRKLDPEVEIDLGAIGKGFAADVVGTYLDGIGAQNYLIAVGGELRARGSAISAVASSGASTTRAGTGWLVGIETPTPDVRRVLRTLELHDSSLSTSGDYRNFIEIDHRQFCHEIDPRTGWPIAESAASVSVLHRSGAFADAMATALIVLGERQGMALAKRFDLQVLFILRGDGTFEYRATPGFAPTVSR